MSIKHDFQEYQMRQIATNKMLQSIDQWISWKENHSIKKKDVRHWIEKETDPIEVIQEKGLHSKFAVTFGHMPASQISLLKYIHTLEQPNVIELGCSSGRMAWKILLAGGKIFANDLHGNQVHKAKKFVHDKIPHKITYLTIDSGDALSVIERNHAIEESFHIVLSQNLIHYLTPQNYISFTQMAHNLLLPGGKLYLTGQHIYACISDLYKGYFNQYPDHEESLQSLFRNSIIDSMTLYSNSGHYFLKRNISFDYISALDKDINYEYLINAFDSNYLRKSLEKAGFQIESYMCLDRYGDESECYDNLSESIEKIFHLDDKTLIKSAFVVVEAMKLSGELIADSDHQDDLKHEL